MSKKFLQASFQGSNHNVNIGLLLILWEEDAVFYQYSPELDLTGYGKSEREASISFEHILQDFLNYTLNKNTLFDELERLGWTTNKKKKRVRAPEEEQLLQDNETYKDLINRPGVQRSSKDLVLFL